MRDPFVVRPRHPRPPDRSPGTGAPRSGAPLGDAPAVADRAPLSRAGAPDTSAGIAPAVLQAPVAAQRPGALEPFAGFLDDSEVTDLFVNGAAGLFVDRGAGPMRITSWRAAEPDVRELAAALVGLGGRHIDDATPCVDVRLDGGLRVHAVLPPVAPDGTLISIRVPRVGMPRLDDLQRRGLVDERGRALLDDLVRRRENVLVSGAAGAGKTTLLAALLAETPPTERIVTIEDVAELRIDHPHHVRLEARQPNLEGAGEVGLARLVREALRMRPDRLVVGECRGAEVRELLSALNTGHDGGAGTLHANALADVPARLEALGALCGLDDRALARQAASAIGRVLHVARGSDGVRRLVAVGRPVVASDGRLTMKELT